MTELETAQQRIAGLEARVQELGQMARDVNSRRVVELEAELAAMRAVGEPVAWQYRSKGESAWFDCAKERVLVRANHPDKWELRALYTHPQPAAQDAEPDMLDAAIDAALAAAPAQHPAPTPQAGSVLEDAARYQWIRGPVEESTRYSRWRIEYWDGPNGWQPMQRERMDSAIDAARKQGEKE